PRTRRILSQSQPHAWNYACEGSLQAPKQMMASASCAEDKPFNFLRTLFEGSVAGGAAGVAAHGGGKIILKGLYSGLAGNLVGVLPASAIFVGVYEPTKQKLLKTFPENLSALAHLKVFEFSETAGAIGGAASSLVRVPTEVVRQRMQTGQFTAASEAGYGSFLLWDLPFDAIQFCIYEQLRMGYKLAARRDLKDAENAIIGAFAGAITGAVSTPLDVMKTRPMVQGTSNQYKGVIDCVRTIVREEGTNSLFKPFRAVLAAS
ncbi:Mitochondrial substrate/solute carrier, partial [Dillenia turbinata]